MIFFSAGVIGPPMKKAAAGLNPTGRLPDAIQRRVAGRPYPVEIPLRPSPNLTPCLNRTFPSASVAMPRFKVPVKVRH